VLRRLFAVAVVAVCVSWMPVSAGEGYVGASYLSTSAEFDTALESFDTDSDGWKLFGGFVVNKYFGIEMTYYDLGDFDEKVNNTTISGDMSAFDLCARGILPLGKMFEISGKLGYSNLSVDSYTTNGIASVGTSSSDWELLYGVGVALKLGSRFGIRADWEAWDVADSLDTWSAGVYFRFGAR